MTDDAAERIPLCWTLRTFAALTPDELYGLLELRQRVFIVEQRCAFLDADGRDAMSLHLLGRTAGGRLLAYLRIVPPGARFAEPSLGRVVSAPEVRHQGYGRLLMQEGLRRAEELYPGSDIRISAQRYLERFYGAFGFVPVGDPYEEDGIPHIDMLRSAGR